MGDEGRGTDLDELLNLKSAAEIRRTAKNIKNQHVSGKFKRRNLSAHAQSDENPAASKLGDEKFAIEAGGVVIGHVDEPLARELEVLEEGEPLTDDVVEVVKARAKAKFLDHSKPLNVHTWSDHPEVRRFVNQIHYDLYAGRELNVRKEHLRVLLLDLYVRWKEDPSLLTTVSKDNNHFKRGSRYNELHISKVTIPVVANLLEAGLIHEAPGFYDRGNPGRSRTARIWPTEILLEKFREARFSQFDVYSSRDRQTVILRDEVPIHPKSKETKQADVEYELTEELAKEIECMSQLLWSYNDLLRTTFIDIPALAGKSIKFDGKFEPVKFSFTQRDKFIRRIFNRGSFKCGGRFWGGWWQRCPKEWRPHIFINDKPTNEVDFSGLHIVILYAMEGIDYWNDIGGDPYLIELPQLTDDPLEARRIVKSLMLVMINAATKEKAFQAFRSEAKKGSPDKKRTNIELSQVIDAFAEKHPAIAKYFGADIGISLMNEDARIAEYVIAEFVGRGVPILCVHDSFIVPNGNEAWLRETMSKGFESIMGIPIPDNFFTLKEKSVREENLENQLLRWVPYKEAKEQQDLEYKEYLQRVEPRRTSRYRESWAEFQEWKRTLTPI